jgi:hypothetical protein
MELVAWHLVDKKGVLRLILGKEEALSLILVGGD